MDPIMLMVYRNWKGETNVRFVNPIRIFFGSTEHHPQEQWLMEAFDTVKGEKRVFAMADMLVQRPSEAPMAEIDHDGDVVTMQVIADGVIDRRQVSHIETYPLYRHGSEVPSEVFTGLPVPVMGDNEVSFTTLDGHTYVVNLGTDKWKG